MIEGQERFGDPEVGPVVPEDIGFTGDHAAVLEDGQRMCQVTGFAAQVGGDAAAAAVAGRDRREHRMVQTRVAQVRFVGE